MMQNPLMDQLLGRVAANPYDMLMQPQITQMAQIAQMMKKKKSSPISLSYWKNLGIQLPQK